MNDVTSLGRTVRLLPNKKQLRRELTDDEREARIALYAERVSRGCDIWTGKPLKQQGQK